MESFSFVHTADLHLDSPFTGLTVRDERVGQALRSATFDAFDALVQLCIDRNVRFLVVAGDVYDSADRSIRAQLRFRDGLARLAEHGIASFVVHGNHDALDGWSSSMTWPDDVHVFGKAVETVVRDEVAVTGISYRKRNEARNLAKQFRAERAERFQIGLLHANCGSDTGHEPYAPCTLADLADAGMDYWALGHVHERTTLAENPHIVYPGNTQGRSFREQDARGCVLVTVQDGQVEDTEFCPLDTVRWLTTDVSIEGLASIDALDQALLEAVEGLRQQADTRGTACRLRLTGRGLLDGELRRGSAVEDLVGRIRESFEDADPFCWLEAIEAASKPEVDLERRRQERDLVAQVLSVAAELAASEDERHPLESALDVLFQDSRARKALDPLTRSELDALLDQAQFLCLDQLEDES